MSYVETVEMKYNGQTAVFNCEGGDVYWASLEDGAWWLQFVVGDPSEGPFTSTEAIAAWLNEDEV